MCALPLVIPCSGAAGHHRRFHRAATSKKFPFSTFYVLIHHYWNSRSSPNNFALSLSLYLTNLRRRWYWCGGRSSDACIGMVGAPKGTRCLTLWWPLAARDLTGISLTFFSYFFAWAASRPVLRSSRSLAAAAAGDLSGTSGLFFLSPQLS